MQVSTKLEVSNIGTPIRPISEMENWPFHGNFQWGKKNKSIPCQIPITNLSLKFKLS